MFIYNLEDIAKKLKIDFDGITKQIEHNGVKGSAREDLLKDYLKKLLPEKYSISSGIIIDNNQNQSKQQDFIIHDSFNCPSFFKTESNSILPIESVYATVEVKSTLDYSTLEQSVKNVESVRKLNRLPHRGIIYNMYDKIYPLGFVFAYSSNYSLEQIQKRLFELNKNIKGSNQISIICILDKGLIFNVKKNNVTEVTLIPNDETLLARSDSGIENTLYSFYLFLLEYLDNVHIQVPSLIEYAKKNKAFNISINIPTELIPDDAVYKEGAIELKYGDARKMLNLNNKYPNLFNGKMTYEEMFNYLKDDFIPLCKIQAQMAKVKYHNKITIYGYEFNPSDFSNFEGYAMEYNSNNNAKEKFDKIVDEIYSNYKKEVKEKKMKINNEYIEIRLCTSADVRDIYEIQNIVIENFKENEKGYFLPFKEESYLRIVNDPINDGEIYGAFLDNKMIAWIFLSVSNRMKEIKRYIPDIEGKCADIDGVIVLPEYRGNHLQNILVEHLEKRAKELGINNIVAEVTFGNEYSLKNLQSMGYEIKTWYQKDENIKRHILLKRLEDN